MRVVQTVLWLGVAASGLAAADKPAPDASTQGQGSAVRSTPAMEGSIEAAKRDLEAIKAARGGLEQPKAGLPQFGAPELQVGNPTPSKPATGLTPAEAAAAKKSANWLVDAMMKRPAKGPDGRELSTAEKDRDRRKDQSRLSVGEELKDGEKDENVTDHVTRSAEAAARDKERERGDERDGKSKSDPAMNPLNNFMSTWMTAKDFKLLQAGAGEGANGGLGAGAGADGALGTPAGIGGGGTVGGPGTATGVFGGEAATRMVRTPKENPFLQDLGVVTPATPNGGVAVVTLPPPVSAAPAPKTAILPPMPEPPPKAGIPAFVKPNDDAKYFKPLKRF